jgi:hypothetical protein
MNHLPLIVDAFLVTALGTVALVLLSWSAMRRAEALAEDLKKNR